MSDGAKIIELKSLKTCNECGHPPGGHEDTCTRSRANMARLVARRQQLIAEGKLKPPGGRRKKIRLTRQEIDELATQTAADMLYGDRSEAVGVLRKQMGSKDERVAQKAALAVLGYTDGTPTQRVETKTDNVTEVVYRSAAMEFEDEFVPEPAADAG